MFPTYLFVGTLGITIAAGIFRVFASGGHPAPLDCAARSARRHASRHALAAAQSVLQRLRRAHRRRSRQQRRQSVPRTGREKRAAHAHHRHPDSCGVLLAGISYLAKSYGITATDPSNSGYQSLLSLLIAAVFGRGFFYYLTIASILLVLSLSANTAFADFPRLCRSIALDNYLPHVFAFRGRRLVYTYGIIILALLTGALLILFGGITDRLIPLYAVGAFLAFTLSQFGMVAHWRKKRGPALAQERVRQRTRRLRHRHHRPRYSRRKIRRRRLDHHPFYPDADRDFLRCAAPLSFRQPDHALHRSRWFPSVTSSQPIAVVPIDHYSQVTRHGLELASRLTTEVIAVHVEPDEHSEVLYKEWDRLVVETFRRRRRSAAKTRSPSISLSLRHRSDRSIHSCSSRTNIPIVASSSSFPNSPKGRWYEYFLHNQRGRLLEWLLLVKGNERIFTLNAPYYLGHHSPAHRSANAGPEASAVIDSLVDQAKSTNPSPSES